ncbi:MAG: hypothetical protein IPH31_19995 [Lewinellaceae bacterium]|nr:hypothetical protein [Lewinellaceae bacterium]
MKVFANVQITTNKPLAMKNRLTHSIIAFLFCLPCVYAQNDVKEWVMVDKKNGNERILKQGQGISVHWNNIEGSEVLKGKLADISEDSLFLSMKAGIRVIGKHDINKIKYRTERSIGQLFIGCLLIVGGIIIAGLSVLFQIVSDTTRIDYQLARGERKLIWPLAFLGLAVVAMGIAILKSNSMKTKNPFEKEWVIRDMKNNPNKSP